MDMGKKLIAGSHSRKELVYINVDDAVSMEKELNEDVCEICGDMIEMSQEMEVFVACEDCGFPVCRECYEYERREGNQVCPRCKTRYRRIKGKNLEDFLPNTFFHANCCCNMHGC